MKWTLPIAGVTDVLIFSLEGQRQELRFSSANGAGLFPADVMFIYIFMQNDIKRTWSNT